MKSRTNAVKPVRRRTNEHWMKKYAKENPLKLGWLSLLGWGTLSLFSYFQYIDYFPNFDLQAAANVLLSLAYIAIIVSTIFAVIMITPAFGILMAQRAAKPIAKPGHFGGQLAEWALFLLLSLCLLILLVMAYSYKDWNIGYASLNYFSCALLLFSLRAKHVPHKFQPKPVPEQHSTRPQRQKKWKKLLLQYRGNRLFAYMFVALLQMIPCMVFLLTLGRASDFKEDDYPGLTMAAMQYAILLAAASCLVVYVFKKNRKYWYALFPLALLLPLAASMCLHAAGMLPMMVAQRTKIGNFYADHITIAAKSCSSVAAALGRDCDAAQSLPVHLCNVHIMSRIGSETYIRLSSFEAGAKGLHATIPLLLPSADINTIQVDFKKKLFSVELIDDNLSKNNSVCATPAPSPRPAP